MVDWVQGTMNDYGYAGIVFLMFLDNVFPPVPSEVIMPLAGFLTEQGRLSYVGVVLAGMAGSTLSALALYYLGYRVGEARLRAWADRHGRWIGLRGKDIDRGKRWFEQHGKAAVFFCRFIPGIRSIISIPAGFAGMDLRMFVLYTALGTGLWAAFLAWLGQLLGENYHQVQQYIKPVSYLVIAGLIVLFIVWAIRRKRED